MPRISFKKHEEPEEELEAVVEETPEEETEDRSAFNCPTCKGEGINGNIICTNCGGTGKI